MRTFAVYQIKKDAKNREDKIFKPYDWTVKKFGTINAEDYCCVYYGRQNVNTLDEIFEMCNICHPDGYSGHSLSVSDIVSFNDKLWYCDVFGWKEI